MTDYQTIQESFWAGEFGDEYVGRNRGESCIEANTSMFTKILDRTSGVRSVLEIAPSGDLFKAVEIMGYYDHIHN